jgi:hypothetical protein
VLDIKPPAGVVLAADYQYNQTHELEGDLQALRYVDLEREGLAEYRAQLQRLGISYMGPPPTTTSSFEANLTNANTYANAHSYGVGATFSTNYGANTPNLSYQPQVNNNNNNHLYSGSNAPSVYGYNQAQAFSYGYTQPSATFSTVSANPAAPTIISELFSNLDRDMNGRISIDEAEKLLLKLNSRLGRRYGEDDVKRFFISLDTNRDGTIDLQEFKAAFERVM